MDSRFDNKFSYVIEGDAFPLLNIYLEKIQK